MSSEQQAWVDAMARWEGLVDATAERARRRDLFAAAALSGLMERLPACWPGIDTLYAVSEQAWSMADAMLSADDATAGPRGFVLTAAQRGAVVLAASAYREQGSKEVADELDGLLAAIDAKRGA